MSRSGSLLPRQTPANKNSTRLGTIVGELYKIYHIFQVLCPPQKDLEYTHMKQFLINHESVYVLLFMYLIILGSFPINDKEKNLSHFSNQRIARFKSIGGTKHESGTRIIK